MSLKLIVHMPSPTQGDVECDVREISFHPATRVREGQGLHRNWKKNNVYIWSVHDLSELTSHIFSDVKSSRSLNEIINLISFHLKWNILFH